MKSLVFCIHDNKVMVPPIEVDDVLLTVGQLAPFGITENFCLLYKGGWTEKHLLWSLYFSHDQLPKLEGREWLSFEEALVLFPAELEEIANVQIPTTQNPRFR